MARASSATLVLVGTAAIGLVGCSRTFRASITEPNPMAYRATDSALPRSTGLYIETRDMELPSSFRLRNTAQFVVVSHDRLRFHVTLNHKWKEMTDITGWDVRLEDDRGHSLRPETKEISTNKHKTHMWDMERRSVLPPSESGSPVITEGQTVSEDFARVSPGIANDGYRERVPLASVDTYRGQGDYVFHAKNLFDRNVQRVTLVMKRKGIEYRFTWNLY